jgi:hypothetical protein
MHAQVSGKVDQSGSMLSEDVAAKGYALLCVAQPASDCRVTTITEVRWGGSGHCEVFGGVAPVRHRMEVIDEYMCGWEITVHGIKYKSSRLRLFGKLRTTLTSPHLR